MSRITGSDALKMFEAYAAVYASEEQVEEVAEEVEQLDEIAVPPKDPEAARAQSAAAKQTMKNVSNAINPVRAIGSEVSKATQNYRSVGPRDVKGRPLNPQASKPSSQPYQSRFSSSRDNAFSAAQNIKGSPVVGSKPAPTAAKPASAPAPTAAKLAPSAGPKVAPAAAKPVAGTKAAGPESIKPKTPNPLLAGGDIQRMIQASKMRQSGINVTSGQLASAERTKPSTLKQSYEYDAYDLVLEYLLDNGHAETVDEAHYIMLEMDVEMVGDIVEETLQEKLKPGTTRVSFSTGKDAKFNQAMTEKNPRTGRQRATSPELKAMGAHGRAKSAQYDAENRGDTEAARRHETRRGKIAHTVYRKTGRIIDRADND